MVPFLLDTFENIVGEMCATFVVDDVMKKANSATALIKLNTFDVNIHKNNVDIGFEVRHEIMTLKKLKKQARRRQFKSGGLI